MGIIVGIVALVVAQSGPLEAAQMYWKEWATARKYRFVVSRDHRLLLLAPEERGKLEHVLELAEKSLARADELLPPPPAPPPPSLAPSDFSPDPETGTGAPPEPDSSTTATNPKVRWVWGDTTNPLDQDTIVFGLFRKPADYAAALDHLVVLHPYLADWLPKGKQDPGCILERPLFGACVDNVAGMEEWNPDNEVVHRTAQLVLRRRFGEQPVWVGLGIGWTVEFDLLKTIYCYPWRSGFVSAYEHGGWEANLKRDFEKREKSPLKMDELTAIKRGSFDLKQAALSWGMMKFLTQDDPLATSRFLAEMHDLRETKGRVPSPDGKMWTMAAGFELAAPDQQAALERAFGTGADVLKQASDSFRLARKWKKPTKKPTAKGGS